jgi:hypothetical protein
MRLFTVLLAVAAFVVGSFASVPARAGGSNRAEVAAERWLGLIDTGHYVASWKQAAPLFQARVTAAGWKSALRTARLPFGKVLARRVTTETLARSLPGVPDGHYAVIRFHTDFAHKAQAGETVTMDRVAGKWRPIGYFVQ